jgi:transposase
MRRKRALDKASVTEGMDRRRAQARHGRLLEAQRNKTDKNDARGLAQLVRSGWFKPVHAKSREANRMKLLLAHRRTLKRKLLDIENEVRQSLKMFGYMVGPRVQRATFQSRIRALVCDDPLLSGATDCMLRCWSALWDEYRKLHKLLVQIVGRDELCRRWCEIPGVGPVTAMTFKAAVDDPVRFAKSKTLGAHFGLTPKRIQSGTSVDQDRAYLKARGRRGSNDALRSGERDDHPLEETLRPQVMGHACRSETRP